MKIFFIYLISLGCFAELSIETFNTGLAHTYVPLAKERLPHIIENLKKNQSDVICLQEVWKKKDRNEIKDKLSKIYPYAFNSEIKQIRTKKKPSCKRSNLFGDNRFVSCTLSNCKGMNGDEFTHCVLTTCGESMERLKNENRMCANALLAQVGRSSISALLQVLNPFRGASLFAYGGSDGLLILSKKPFSSKTVLDFSTISTLNKRAALVVEIEDEKKIVCTHLTANLSNSVSYAGKFSNWKEENKKQIEALLEFDKNNEKTILIGDLNCAFSRGGMEPDWEDNCQMILDKGFSNEYILQSPSCTYCSTNTHVSNDEKSILIDHIFVKNISVNNQSRSRENIISINGLSENLSDHFGLRAVIE